MNMPKLILAMVLVFCSHLSYAQNTKAWEEMYSLKEENISYCSSLMVQRAIISEFKRKERSFWNSSKSIVSFEKVQEESWLPWKESSISRHFCKGVVLLNNGKKTNIYYSIREGLGFLNFGWDIQWCLQGHDYNYGYGAQCRGARP